MAHQLTLLRAAQIGSCSLIVLLGALRADADTLQVGPGKTYDKPCAAIAAATMGDVIEIDAGGNYDGDVCGWATNGLTIRGVGGRAKIDAAGQAAQDKGIWVIAGDDTLIENIELSGASVKDTNGAGIRHQGGNLTVRNCYFHDNEDGILAGSNPSADIVIEYSEFANNGYQDGKSHNLYINHVRSFTLRYSYSHSSKIGHLLKSRARNNYILYNRLSGEDGSGSYEIDLPNGGTSYVIGNLIQQGPNTDNPSLLSYQKEGPHADNPGHDLYVINNSFVNDGPSGKFVNVDGSVSTPVIIRNNIFMGPGTVTSQGNAVQEGNYVGDPSFVDKDSFDYRLTAASPCVDTGVMPGNANNMSLAPDHHYVHPADMEGRLSVGAIDIGAYELNGGISTGGGGAGLGGGMGTGQGSGGEGGSSTTTSSGDGGGSSSTNSAGAAANEDAEGCGCRLAGAFSPLPTPWLALLGLTLLAVRRRVGPNAGLGS